MKKVAAAALLLLLAAFPAVADHAPEWLLAKRSTILRVLRIKVDGATIRDAIRRFGKPASRTADPKFPGEAGVGRHHLHLSGRIRAEGMVR